MAKEELTNKDKLPEKSLSWSKTYYSIPMYILLALVLPIGISLAGDWLAESVRAAKGLPAVRLEGFDTFGVGMVATFLMGVNVVYGTVALIVGIKLGRRRVKRILFTVGLFLLTCSAIYVTYLNYQLVVDAPANGYSKWIF